MSRREDIASVDESAASSALQTDCSPAQRSDGVCPTKCVVFFSGGLMSWAAAKRAVARWGAENTTLLFTDTLIEDPDLYRFIDEAAANVGAPLVKIADGRGPWEVFRDEQIIGNQRIDPCSRVLKREIGERWLAENCDPADTILIFGIHWEESHRLATTGRDGKPRGLKNRYRQIGWPNVDATMCWAPWMSPQDVTRWAQAEGLTPPRLYALGFSHNNCGGFCVKAGEGHFMNLLKQLPEVYAHHEAQEEAFNAARPGKRRQTVLAPERVVGWKWVVREDFDGRERRVKVPDRKRVQMTMREFREAAVAGEEFDLFDVGGCGCFLEDAA